jgi:uncharacterized membrane protein YphA (DoxX/SURF4 family)
MLTPFPNLLVYAFFAPTMLRAAAAATLFYLAYQQWLRRDEIARLDHFLVGKNSWTYAASALFNLIVGGMLLFGYYTQWAALLAAAGQLYGLWLNHRHPQVVILADAAVLLLIAVCLSLLLTGAGALAYDLPL